MSTPACPAVERAALPHAASVPLLRCPLEQLRLPEFSHGIASIPSFLDGDTAARLAREAIDQQSVVRSYVPGHKQGGTVAYVDMRATAPMAVSLYHSQELAEVVGRVVGAPVVRTPLHDQNSCSFLFYQRVGDRIGWHYDHNFYRGRHFTVLLSVVNQGSTRVLSSAQLQARLLGHEVLVPTPPNQLVIFEGRRVRHQVTPLAKDELRIVLSMTYCTDPTASHLMDSARRIKDMAYFGIRSLWLGGRRTLAT
jgi:hypothetical protein